MRHYWVIIRTDSIDALDALRQQAKRSIPKFINFHPEQITVRTFDETTLLISCVVNMNTFLYEKCHCMKENSATLVEGLPSLEQFGVPPISDIPDEVDTLLETHGEQTLYEKLGGVWSIAHVNRKYVSVF